MNAVFSVLYTPNLTQKRKKWFDGRLKYNAKRGKSRLLDEDGRPLAEKAWPEQPALPQPGDQVHFSRFIVEIDAIESIEAVPPQPPQPPPLPHPSNNANRVLQSRKRALGLPLSLLLRDPKLRVQPRDCVESSREATEGRLFLSSEGSSEESLVGGGGRGSGSGSGSGDNGDNGRGGSGAHGNDEDEGIAGGGEDVLSVPPPTSGAGSGGAGSGADADFETLEPESDLHPPLSYDLTSDLESDVEFVGAAERPRSSLFADMPADFATSGPWTKEAYLLFSWHPPTVKEEPV